MNPQHTAETAAAVSIQDLTTVDGLVASNPTAFSVSVLRWQLRHRHESGLAAACVKVGKRILISRSRYEAWLASQTGA
jgi:hypothetical protein